MDLQTNIPLSERAALMAALRCLVDIGADEGIDDAPRNRTLPSPEPFLSAPEAVPDPARPVYRKDVSPPPRTPGPPSSAPLPVPGRNDIALRAAAAAAAAPDLAALSGAVAAFEGIALRETATKMVFSDGRPGSCVMLIGEAPGADEDRQGKPFVGVSGQLLDKVLLSIGLSRRDENPLAGVYISNILNWRPPGNRTPTDSEVEASLPFIERHIVLAAPKLLILCGAVSASALLGRKEKIGRLRGRWHAWSPLTPGLAPGGFSPIPALATYHPSFLLRSPEQKRAAWEDMRTLLKKRIEMNLLCAAPEEGVRL